MHTAHSVRSFENIIPTYKLSKRIRFTNSIMSAFNISKNKYLQLDEITQEKTTLRKESRYRKRREREKSNIKTMTNKWSGPI